MGKTMPRHTRKRIWRMLGLAQPHRSCRFERQEFWFDFKFFWRDFPLFHICWEDEEGSLKRKKIFSYRLALLWLYIIPFLVNTFSYFFFHSVEPTLDSSITKFWIDPSIDLFAPHPGPSIHVDLLTELWGLSSMISPRPYREKNIFILKLKIRPS